MEILRWYRRWCHLRLALDEIGLVDDFLLVNSVGCFQKFSR